MPKRALDWLFGEGPDDNGRWFDLAQFPEVYGKYHGRTTPYWWRTIFRNLLASAPRPDASTDGGRRELAAVVLEKRYPKIAFKMRGGMRSSSWPEDLVDPGLLLDLLEASCIPAPRPSGSDLAEKVGEQLLDAACDLHNDELTKDELSSLFRQAANALTSLAERAAALEQQLKHREAEIEYHVQSISRYHDAVCKRDNEIAALQQERDRLKEALTAPGNPLWLYTQYDWLCDRLEKFKRGELSDDLAPPELIEHLRKQSDAVKELLRAQMHRTLSESQREKQEGGEDDKA